MTNHHLPSSDRVSVVVSPETFRSALTFNAELWGSQTEATVLGKHWRPSSLTLTYAVNAEYYHARA